MANGDGIIPPVTMLFYMRLCHSRLERDSAQGDSELLALRMEASYGKHLRGARRSGEQPLTDTSNPGGTFFQQPE